MTWSDALPLAREKGMPEMNLHTQTHAAGFYRRYGVSARGEGFLEAGIPHQEMHFRRTRAPEA